MSKLTGQKKKTLPAIHHGLILAGQFKVILLMFLSCLLLKTSSCNEKSQNTGQVMLSPENKRGKVVRKVLPEGSEKVAPETLPGVYLL